MRGLLRAFESLLPRASGVTPGGADVLLRVPPLSNPQGMKPRMVRTTAPGRSTFTSTVLYF